jgi:hypothetical protein
MPHSAFKRPRSCTSGKPWPRDLQRNTRCSKLCGIRPRVCQWKFPAAGVVASFFKVRRMRSWRAILLWVARLDALDADAQSEPPHGKLAQIEGVCGGQGHPIITADVGRQTAFLEKPLKHSKSVVFSGRGKRLTSELVAPLIQYQHFSASFLFRLCSVAMTQSKPQIELPEMP